MKPEQRYEWILDQMAAVREWRHVDVLNHDFVNAYIEATDASFRPTNYGAHKCPQLGRDLSTMYDKYMLRRHRVGIDGLCGMGFPKWVYSYSF